MGNKQTVHFSSAGVSSIKGIFFSVKLTIKNRIRTINALSSHKKDKSKKANLSVNRKNKN